MKRTMLAIGLLSIALATPALCAEKAKSKKMMDATPAQREEMAAAHEKMAACLRSEKPMMDCHKEMMESCKEKMGKNSCPMMGDMGHMHEMMGKGMKHDHGKMKEEESDGDEKK